MDLDSLNWGDVPAWILILVSVAGVIAAVFAGIYASRIYRIERKRDLNQQQREDKFQAELISAWAEFVSDSPSQNANFSLAPKVQNLSSQPIYDLLFFWNFKGSSIHQDTANVIPPNSPYTWNIPIQVFNGNYSVLEGRSGMTFPEASHIMKESRLSIEFSDAENRRWKRDQQGKLSRVTTQV